MPTPTYTPIANVTLASNATSVTFSSITGSYRDIIAVANLGGTGVNSMYCQINGDTSFANYPSVHMKGDGSSTSSASYTTLYGAAIGAFSGTPTTVTGNMVVQFMDYSATDKHKTILSRWNTASVSTEAFATRWASTSAITSIKFYVGVGNSSTPTYDILAGSTFSLFGVAA